MNRARPDRAGAGIAAGGTAGTRSSMTATTEPLTPAGAGHYDHPTGAEELRAEVIEQVMRCCDDPNLAAAFYRGTPGSTRARADVGQVLTSHHIPLTPGSPLAAWAHGGTLDPGWRYSFPPRPESAYAHLMFLAQLYGPAPFDCDLVEHLTWLRNQARDDLTP